MELSIYDHDMSSSSEWALFSGQLLTVPDTPAASNADLGGHVLQDWSGEAVGQLVGGHSPVDEILQDSIWSDTVDVSTLQHLSSSLFQKDDRFIQKTAFTQVSSSDKAFLLYEDDGDVLENITLTFDDGSYVTAPLSEVNSHSSSPIDLESEDDFIDTLENFLSEPPLTIWDQGNLKTDKSASDHSILNASDIRYLLPFHQQCGLNSIPQEVPYIFNSVLDSFDDENYSLHDPESVCKILEQLGEGKSSGDLDLLTIEPLLSPVSPEEVESVLSYNSVTAKVPQAASPSYNDSQVDMESSFCSSSESSLTSFSDYMQSDLTLKLESTHSQVNSKPYCVEQKVDRKLKKKEQNKTAAHRYRIKKREEKGVVLTEVEELEQRNSKLKEKADDLTREINYLKALLEEIRKQ